LDDRPGRSAAAGPDLAVPSTPTCACAHGPSPARYCMVHACNEEHLHIALLARSTSLRETISFFFSFVFLYLVVCLDGLLN
jgi:hypothetical protein